MTYYVTTCKIPGFLRYTYNVPLTMNKNHLICLWYNNLQIINEGNLLIFVYIAYPLINLCVLDVSYIQFSCI